MGTISSFKQHAHVSIALHLGLKYLFICVLPLRWKYNIIGLHLDKRLLSHNRMIYSSREKVCPLFLFPKQNILCCATNHDWYLHFLFSVFFLLGSLSLKLGRENRLQTKVSFSVLWWQFNFLCFLYKQNLLKCHSKNSYCGAFLVSKMCYIKPYKWTSGLVFTFIKNQFTS